MLYHLSLILREYVHTLNVLHYVTLRAAGALLTGLILSLIMGKFFITRLSGWLAAQARAYTPSSHQAKSGTPTMGGIYILVTVWVTLLLWGNLLKPELWLFLLCFTGFGAIGFWDDWSKIRFRKGISERSKLIAQLAVATITAILWILIAEPSRELVFPFFKHLHPDLGLLFIPWVIFILVGTSNAVNLTDGLDGLAITSLILNFATFSGILYVSGHFLLANYLHIPFTGNAELVVAATALIGASLGFLWYNAYPADIFMGDVGSLSLGAALGFLALLSKQELLLAVSGGLFVLETLSVIAQVLSIKLRGKRIFKMAPIHHHFELLGWPESKITIRFGIITLILCLLALVTLKIR